MFKLVVLSALLAIAAARPGYLHEAPLAYSASVVHEPVLAKVGAIVKSVPTAVSHQSQSVVHSHAHSVTPIVAPVAVKTTYAAPVVQTYAAAPAVHTSYASYAPAHIGYAAPVHVGYAAPALHYSSGWESSW